VRDLCAKWKSLRKRPKPAAATIGLPLAEHAAGGFDINESTESLQSVFRVHDPICVALSEL